MICLRCNHENDVSSKICAVCGADLYINSKTRNIAVKLYNKGLSLARERKLTEAVEAINKSLSFDRFNIDARNVLGLLYIELGMVADALKQWAVSASYMNENNMATVYLARIKDNVREMEKMNDAVKMYNQGLVNIKNKNDDMAVIQLKKAIDLNPKLIEAKNLLALIYASTSNSALATQMIDTVAAHDVSNNKALSYNLALGRPAINTQKYRQAQAAREPVPPKQKYDPYIQKKVKRFGRLPLSEAISLILGAACAVAAMYILVIPSMEAESKAEQERQQSVISAMVLDHEKAIAEKDAEIDSLVAANEELARANDEIIGKTSILEKQQKIMTVVSLNATGNIREAAAIIKDLDIEGLSDADISQYNSIKEAVFPQMAKILYDEGRAAYNARNYDEAKTAFLSGLEYGMTVSNAGDSYYFLGRIAEYSNDLVSAKQNYEKTVNEYRDCTQYYNASNRLAALNR